jgi:hypothetical protein
MKTALLVMPLLLLTACASTPSDVQTRQKAKPTIKLTRMSDCVSESLISGFQALDNRHIILFGSGHRKAYLVEIAPACFDVAHQNTLATVDGDNNNQICGFGRDSIVYEQFGRLESCRVMGMEELTDERLLEVQSTK